MADIFPPNGAGPLFSNIPCKTAHQEAVTWSSIGWSNATANLNFIVLQMVIRKKYIFIVHRSSSFAWNEKKYFQ
jgi:hypothetical protein